MAAGDHDRRRSAPTPRAGASSTPAATAGATTPVPSPAASASATRTSTGSSPRSPAARSPAPRWRGPGGRSRPDPPRRAHEPPRRGEPRVARARARLARRGVHRRGARPLVPGGGDERHASLEAGRATYFKALARLAPRKAQRRRTPRRTADVAVDIARLERFVARFRYKISKAKQAQAKLTQIGRLTKEKDEAASRRRSSQKDPGARLRLRRAEAKRPRRARPRAREPEVAGRPLLTDVTFALERGDHVALVGPNGSGKTTLLERAVAGDFKLGHGVEVGYFSSTGSSWTNAERARLRPGDDKPQPPAGADASRPLPLLGLGRA